MKTYLTLLLLIASTAITYCQSPAYSIHIQLDTIHSRYFDRNKKSEVRMAFDLMNKVFNSEQFQKEIAATSLNKESYCAENGSGKKDKIPGTEILETLFKEKNPTIKITLRRRGSAMGATSANSYNTKAWYKNIVDDMPELPFAYALAVNLCHEYMHQVGYCHLYCTGKLCPEDKLLKEPGGGKPDPGFYKEDVTYHIGWLAYYILRDWYLQK